MATDGKGHSRDNANIRCQEGELFAKYDPVIVIANEPEL